MVITAAFAHEYEAAVEELQIPVRFLGDIFVHLVTHDELTLCGTRVGSIDVKAVLVAVLREHEQALRVVGETDSGHIAVLVQGQLHLLDTMALDVIGVYGYRSIRLASHRVLIGVGTGVGGELVAGRCGTAVEREGIL